MFTLRNQSSAALTAISRGAALTSLTVPDRSGVLADVLLGYPLAADYVRDNAKQGAVVGRFANRIAGARFTLDGKQFNLTPNHGPHLLHGGDPSFSERDWACEPATTNDGRGLRFSLVSRDGDQGFPGTLSVSTSYVWTDDYRLIVDFAASTDQPTPFNIAQHSYWNLGGSAEADIHDHWLSINADHVLAVTDDLIPTGALDPVAGTVFDVRKPKRLGDIMSDPALRLTAGFDHCWVLCGTGLREVANLFHPPSGRRLTIATDQPGIQVYTGNHLGGGPNGKTGKPYHRYTGIALETQHFPDSPNQPHFPGTILRPGIPFHSRTVFAFGVE
jgi:aldose 1-epimerase